METGTSSVRNAIRVVEQVSIDGSVGVSDLSRQLDLPKSTVQRTLSTLRSAGWLRQDAQSRWALTLRCANIGRNVVREYDVRVVADPIAVELRDRTHETVRYFLIEGDSVLLLGTAESDLAVRPFETELAGVSVLHAAAVGRATLAAMPTDQMERMLDRPLTQITQKTLTDPVALRAEIEATRKRGWGQAREDLYLDVGGVGAVAPLHDDVFVGIGVSYPLHRTPARTVTAYGRMVRAAIDEIAAGVKPLLQPAP
ncbi:MAG TPA: IclR family transcriptional regulator [Acidimicrobiia bacterium]|jgi:IclR family acetate operon transcriptional repressor